MRLIFLCLLIVLVSCATEAPPAAKKSETPPFYRRYRVKDKELIYVVAPFTKNIDLKSQQLIDETIRKFDPELILTNYPVENKPEVEKEFSACDNLKNCSTVVWTCQLAKKRGIPCLSAEPYHSDILKETLKSGKHSDDVMFFYTYRDLVVTLPGKKDPLQDIDSLIEENKKKLNIFSTFDKYDFIRIYKENVGPTVKIGPKNLEKNPDGNYIQQLSQIIETSYYNLLFKKMEQEHAASKRLMIVYGPSTFNIQRSALEEHFSDHIP